MTERQGLKKIVRERMGRTGESYSTALRQVRRVDATVPKPAVPPSGPAIAGYASFGAQRHHPSSLARHLLGQVDVALSEPMVCGLGGGIGFLYAVFEYADLAHPLLTIVAQHHPQPWVPAVFARLRVPFTEQHSTSTPAAMRKLRRELDAGSPVLCTVDRAGLAWHTDLAPMLSADPYPVVVVGADDGTVWLDDVAAMPQAIEADRFATAWAAHRKGRHRMLTVSRPTGAPDLVSAVREAVATTIAHLTGPVLGHAFDVNLGFSGMAKLAAELRERDRRRGWARRFATPVAFEHAMRRLDACLQREYTAPDATRPIFADFLDEAAALLPDAATPGPSTDAIRAAARLVRESGAGWAALSRTARRALEAGRPDDGGLRGLLDELAELVESNLDLERRAVEHLRSTPLR